MIWNEIKDSQMTFSDLSDMWLVVAITLKFISRLRFPSEMGLFINTTIQNSNEIIIIYSFNVG